tara:strand:+ start:186 stop:509 length:324 start_codon:yes stop_codon:yes gene_type:complete
VNLWKKGISGNKCRDKQKYHYCQWRDVHVFLYSHRKNLKVVAGRHGVWLARRIKSSRSHRSDFFLTITTTTTISSQLDFWNKGISGNKCREEEKYHYCQWRDVHVFI